MIESMAMSARKESKSLDSSAPSWSERITVTAGLGSGLPSSSHPELTRVLNLPMIRDTAAICSRLSFDLRYSTNTKREYSSMANMA